MKRSRTKDDAFEYQELSKFNIILKLLFYYKAPNRRKVKQIGEQPLQKGKEKEKEKEKDKKKK